MKGQTPPFIRLLDGSACNLVSCFQQRSPCRYLQTLVALLILTLIYIVFFSISVTRWNIYICIEECQWHTWRNTVKDFTTTGHKRIYTHRMLNITLSVCTQQKFSKNMLATMAGYMTAVSHYRELRVAEERNHGARNHTHTSAVALHCCLVMDSLLQE